MLSLYELLSLKYPNISIGLHGDIQLADYGQGDGPFIKYWNIPDIEQPTPDELAALQTDETVVAGYTAQQNAITNAPIITQLDIIDAKSIRALRTNDTVRLAALEAEAVILRAQLVH